MPKGKGCSVCVSLHRPKIDSMLLAHKSPLTISQELGLPKSSLYRHRDHLLRSRMRASPEAYQHKLEERVDRLYDKTVKLEKAAIGVGNLTAWASALKEMRAAIELEARLSGGFAPSVHKHLVEGQVEVRQVRADAIALLSPSEQRTLKALARKLSIGPRPPQPVIEAQATRLEGEKTWDEVAGREDKVPAGSAAGQAAAQAEAEDASSEPP